ncbi:uncharacterized protein LOC108624712 isoform X3 [Ceratina calcarata]|uniref:Uncharacterized protein LOC108624712 isoform X3 n=1 Tax=Ceratina calcarata TaxID=156304 RepID=A0AAJ7S1W0_9HYME|nr:uncharacterized protein LOC108624712 isoform X3 [Ceratina calcarata]
MIVESIFSCCNLLLTCGSSIYVLTKHSYAQYSKLMMHITCACTGIAIIGSRSLIVLVYKLFVKEYSKLIWSFLITVKTVIELSSSPVIDPTLMEIEEEKNMGRLNVLNEILGILSMGGLIYSLYSCHGYYILGICVVTGLSILDIVKLYRMNAEVPEKIEKIRFHDSPFHSSNPYDSKYNVLIWAIILGR